ncbi:hypothetical protein BKA64DRAFT_741346 [Cadophora sp. MPI-SDFR-AT-0126]|nr:hypothetical protein BKA64DRAFT_741346 [Leotiomycetes sp. MPI-SDFR-AT-0126]
MNEFGHGPAESGTSKSGFQSSRADPSPREIASDGGSGWFDDGDTKDTQVMDFVLGDNHTSGVHAATINLGSASLGRPRSSSLPISFGDGSSNGQSRPIIDPFAAWDDSTLFNRHCTVMPVDDDSILELDVEKLRVAIRRAKTTDRSAASGNLVEQLSDQDSSTGSSSPWEHTGEQMDASNPLVPAVGTSGFDWKDPLPIAEEWNSKVEAPNVPVDENFVSCIPSRSRDGEFLVDRFEQPVKYFRELNELGCRIYENSLFQRYIDGTKHQPFDSKITFEVPFTEQASIELSKWPEILWFCGEVTNAANEQVVVHQGTTHVVANGLYDHVLTQLKHLIECRNIMSRVWENIRLMRTAQYCDEFISLLVLDRTRRDVARLVRIECGTIEKLATEFESCLYQVVCDQPKMVLGGKVITYAKDVSTTCRQLLADAGLEFQGLFMEDLWRCTVHLLDMAALSYAGTHTQSLGNESVTAVVLPGAFFETQYYIFRRRKFSCLSNFLGGREAWVLEDIGSWILDIHKHFPDMIQVRDLPPLFLSTEAMTFGDIWGPMWKRCMVGNEDVIMSYDVGGGAIIPWTLASENTVKVEKGEVFCHWMARNVECENESLAASRTFLETDILLIGAPIQLRSNDRCQVSSEEIREQLRNSESFSHLGAARACWRQETRTFTAAVTPPHLAFGFQQAYKLNEGRSMKNAFIENWMNNPESRSVRSLELRLGLEVSTCTYNARRVRIIELFETNTMVNHLRDTSLNWKTQNQRARFLHALLDDNHKAFRDLWDTQPSWRPELGNAISCGLSMLRCTGKTKNDELQLFWVPERNQPGVCATLRANDITWIGFLEETIDSGVMAVLENRCLELPPLTRASRDIFSRFQNKPVLQTAIHLNDACIPKSLQGRYRESRNPKSKYKGYWQIKYVEKGDMFSFGPRSRLETIARLGAGSRNDQVLAIWRRPNGPRDIVVGMQHTIRETAHSLPGIGRFVDRPPPPAQHHEVGQDSIERESDTELVHFHIVSTETHTLPYSHNRLSTVRPLQSSDSAIEQPRPYEPAIPRSMVVNAKLQRPATSIAETDVLGQVQ